MHEILGIHYEPSILAVIGVIIAVSFLGSKAFQRVGVPQVVGFILIGVALGPSLLNVVPLELGDQLVVISEIALGLIGFDIGSHLLFGDLRRLGRSILTILLFEAIGTFLLVTLGIYALTQSWYTAFIFGALASATAPAATVDVLAEYDAKGPLTTTLLAVVGMDDALALLLYSVAAAFAESLLAHAGPPSIVQILKLPLIEIGGALLMGGGLGLVLDQIMCRMKVQHDAMAVSIGFVLLGVGLSEAFGFSLILTSMIMG
ncbi:MAG: cation:proton antiporter, partial [Anaerolineae bacterium]